MRIGIESKRVLLLRHLGMAAVSALLVYLFYLSYAAWGVQPALWPDWGEDHPFWRAWAHAAFVLLFLTLILSPASTLWNPIKRLLPWRRELGIWFAVLSVGHAYAIWDRWALWDVATLFGFDYAEELGSYILVRPEVGIMNMMGLIMLPMILLLAVTSSDRFVDALGASSWKWIHRTLVPTIFYIAMLRGTLYFFYFFQTSPPNWQVYPPIWFLYVFLGMGVAAVLIQGAAFAKIVLRRRSRQQQNGVAAVAAVSVVVILFVMPLALMMGTVAFFDSRALAENPTLAAGPDVDAPGPAVEDYAQSFEMALDEAGQQTLLWVRDLDGSPDFRITVEIRGGAVSHQIYRFDEQALYLAEQGDDEEMAWSRMDDVQPDEIGLRQMLLQPAAWAAEYGPGEHMIPVQGVALQVTIRSVEDPITDEVFEVPEDVEPVSR